MRTLVVMAVCVLLAAACGSDSKALAGPTDVQVAHDAVNVMLTKGFAAKWRDVDSTSDSEMNYVPSDRLRIRNGDSETIVVGNDQYLAEGTGKFVKATGGKDVFNASLAFVSDLRTAKLYRPESEVFEYRLSENDKISGEFRIENGEITQITRRSNGAVVNYDIASIGRASDVQAPNPSQIDSNTNHLPKCPSDGSNPSTGDICLE